MKGTFIKEITYPECCEQINENTVIVLPIGGGSKEHGSHLPMGTDYYVTDYLAAELTRRCEVVTLPTLPFAYFPAFVGWKGSVHIEAENFMHYVEDILYSFVRFGVKKFIIIDGGISTHIPLQILSSTMRNKYGATLAVTNFHGVSGPAAQKVCQQKSGGHGDEEETSTMLAIRPDLVKMELAAEEYNAPKVENQIQDGLAVAHIATAMDTPHGVNGNSKLATREKGEYILENMVERLVLFTEGFIRWNPEK